VRLETPRGTLDVRTVAFDLDRTLTDERLRAVPAALRAIDGLREAGTTTILVTGRIRREMSTRRALLARFDGLVLESGGLIGSDVRALRPTSTRTPAVDGLARALDDLGVDYERGDTCLSISTSDESALASIDLRRTGLAAHRNRDRIDVTARGVDKGAGLRMLLQADGRPVLAFGDGENDRPLFEAADHRVAVANAVPELRALAHEATAQYGGRGVAAYLNERLLALEAVA